MSDPTAPPPLASPNLRFIDPPSQDVHDDSELAPTFVVSPPTQDVPLPSGPSSGQATPMTFPSALRRSSSSASSDGGSAPGSREKKKLRFTPLPGAESTGLGLNTGDVFYPGDRYARLEEGHYRGGKGIPKDQKDYLKSDPGTPNIQETADQIRRTLSLANLDALLTISADAAQRDKVLADVQRAGRDFVWRSHDEEALYPKDMERALVLAAKRGLRSFILGLSVRSGVNVLIMIFRTFRKKRLRIAMILHAIFGAEPFRFGAMIGTFTFLNTIITHTMRLSPPLSYFQKRYKFGWFNTPSFGPPERDGPEGERRYQAAIAGAIASLALLWETSGRRRGIAQQMFVRGLQASYNQYTPRYGIRIPHGDVLLFGLCCGQIMYAWLVSPETLPPEYSKWILGASRVPEFALLTNRNIIKSGDIDPLQVHRATQHRGVTPSNKDALIRLLKATRAGVRQPAAVPCEMTHPWLDSCVRTSYERFFSVFRFMLPVYSALHLIPMLVLRRNHFKRDPLAMLARATWGITRSCSFLGVFVVIYQSLFCWRSQTLTNPEVNKSLRELLSRKETFWALGFSTCLSLFAEEKKRRAELAMYVLPRALESAWSAARKRAWLPIVPFGETILGAAAMAMVMDAYKNQPDAMSGIVRKLLYQLVGPV